MYNKGTFTNPKRWADSGVKGDIYYNPANSLFYVFKKKGNPHKNKWYYPPGAEDNKNFLFGGKQTGTREQPKTWSEYGTSGCIYHGTEYGYMRLKMNGDPSRNKWYFPFNGESNSYWDFMGWKAGTFMDAKSYGDDGVEGDIYYIPERNYFYSLKHRANPSVDKLPLPAHREETRHWKFRGYLSTKNWLSFINDSHPINQLSVPGTHNAATYTIGKNAVIGAWAKTQYESVGEQLLDGVRYIDARCRHISNSFTMHHDKFYLHVNFGTILSDCYKFLEENPSEFIFMSIKSEHTEESCSRSFAETFEEKYYNPEKWFVESRFPKLAEVRGKIVLLKRFKGGAVGQSIYWVNNSTFNTVTGSIKLHVQDKYNERNESAKWCAIKDAWDFSEYKSREGWMTINFTSIAADDFTSTKSYARDKNPELANYIRKRKSFGGVVASDFYQIGDLAKRVIETNFKSVTDM
ncbi:phosphatidylinositol-specific phospholipase C [Erwinia amylovora]|uniref:phosphatidylinositol-specific phospholipase C n=1 Tax=Erwinia amylovora TaxID=552 RepID=UPI0014441D1B|nr:phosphatidylinositol-specific phospholipase C [Erwinia amylovora]